MSLRSDLTSAEMDVLRVLWDDGPSTVRGVNAELGERGKRWAYSTVATLIGRLSVKGFIATDSTAIPHVYSAAVSRQELLGRRLRDTADDLCDGNPAPLLLALVEGARLDAADLERFQRILDDARREAPPARKPKSR